MRLFSRKFPDWPRVKHRYCFIEFIQDWRKLVKQTVTYLVSSSRSFGEHQPLLLVDANEDEAVEHQASIASAVVVPSSRLPLPQRSIYDQTRSLIRQNDNEQCTSKINFWTNLILQIQTTFYPHHHQFRRKMSKKVIGTKNFHHGQIQLKCKLFQLKVHILIILVFNAYKIGLYLQQPSTHAE